MIQLDTICNVGKSLTAKATKDESGAPTTVAQMKFSDLQVDRDTVDELLGETIGATTATQRIIDGLGRGQPAP